MKKKLITVVLILTLVATLLTGCSFIRKNNEREANQIVATVEKYGVKLSVSQSEMMDYINSNAGSLVQNYGYTVEEAIRYLSDRKVETKLLILEGVNYLKNLNADPNSKRKSALLATGTGTLADGVLTWGEYYNAIKSVNDTMQTNLDTSIATYNNNEKKSKIKQASTKDIEKIEIVEGMKKEYLVGDELDTDLLQLKITYLKDSAGNAASADKYIPVTDAMISTAFDSSKVSEKNTLVITFTANNKNADGEYEAVDMTAEYDYEVKKAPTTRTKTEEEKDDTVVERYGDIEAITAGYDDGLPEVLDLDKKIAATKDAEKSAYSDLKTTIAGLYRTIQYYYDSAIENEILAALQWELQQTALSEKNDAYWDAEIAKQFDYLTSSAFLTYDVMNEKEQKTAFITAIGTALTSLYYIPEWNDQVLQDFAWVSQILFSFTDDQKSFLGSTPTDKAYELVMDQMTVDEANPKYEPNHEHDDKCEEGCNKDVPYLNYNKFVFKDVTEQDGSVTLSVYSQLCLDLSTATTSAERLKIFEDYLYRYNSDDGIFNNDLGYLITPEGETTSWVDTFAKLGRDLIQNSKDSDGLPVAGYYAMKNKGESGEQTITVNGTSVVKVAYAPSTYGIHLMMVKYTPFNDIIKDKETYAFKDGYRFSVDTKLTDGNRETGAESTTTFKKTLETNVKSEIKTKAYSEYIEKVITEENKTSADTKISVNEKKLKGIIKKYTTA